jgi:hypothetical protein
MPTARARTHKHFQLDALKIKRAPKLSRAKTETETIDRALDLAIDEFETNRRVLESHDRFARSGILIHDVFAKLADEMRSALFDTSGLHFCPAWGRRDRLGSATPNWRCDRMVNRGRHRASCTLERPSATSLLWKSWNSNSPERDVILVPDLIDWIMSTGS